MTAAHVAVVIRDSKEVIVVGDVITMAPRSLKFKVRGHVKVIDRKTNQQVDLVLPHTTLQWRQNMFCLFGLF